MRDSWSYTKKVIGLGFIALWVVVAINFLVDPFDIFPSPKITGVNFVKTEIAKQMRLTKAFQLRQALPEVVMVGNSRVEVALDPRHPVLRQYSSSIYNIGLPGGTLYEALRYLQHAHQLAPIKLAILGLDRNMFTSESESGFDEDILATAPVGRKNLYPVLNIVRTLMSLDTLSTSINTVMNQHQPVSIQFRADGMRLPESADYAVKKAGGSLRNFRREMAAQLANHAEEPMDPKIAFGYFRQILDFCRANRIDLRLFIHPVHTWAMEIEQRLGQSDASRKWRREIVNVVTEEAGNHYPPFPLWDFSSYNIITTEQLPSGEDHDTQMKYYWEPRHYKKFVGDLILDRMFKYQDSARVLPEDFGILLNDANLDDWEEKIQKSRNAYVMTHASDIAEIGRLIQASRSRKFRAREN